MPARDLSMEVNYNGWYKNQYSNYKIFVIGELVVVDNFIAHAANVMVNAVKAAVEEVRKVVDAAVECIKDMAAKAFEPIIKEIKDAMEELIDIFRDVGVSIYNAIFKGEVDNTVFKKICEFMSSPLMITLITLPIVVSGIYFAITAASMGIGALVMSFLQGYIVQLIINAIVQSLSQLHFTVPAINDVFAIPGGFINVVIDTKGLETVNGVITAIGFAGGVLGTMIGYYLFRGPIDDYKALMNIMGVLRKAETGLDGVDILSDKAQELLTNAENAIREMKSILGKYGSDANAVLSQSVNNLQQGVVASGKILVAGIVALAVEIVSIAMSVKHVDAKYQALASGISAGLGLYTFYKALKNKLVLPGPFELMDKIGFGATVVSILSSGAQMGLLLGSKNNGGT